MLLLSLGLGLTLCAWLLCRAVAGAWRPQHPSAWLLDLSIPLLMFSGWLLVLGRPLAAGVVTLALIGGFAFADWGKRAVLREPVVFTDWSELIELVRHPHLYLPFVGPLKVIAGALAAVLALGALLWLEPPLPPWRWWTPPLAFAAWVLVVIAFATVLLKPAARLLSRFPITGDPFEDARALGPLAVQFIYGMPTRLARPALRAQHAPSLTGRASPERPPSIVLVQSESFFDPRRLDPSLSDDTAPNFARLAGEAVHTGRFEAAAWGANTTRTEFEVLFGRPLESIGLDRYNPYHAFAHRPLDSLAWRLRAQGYRTVCIHPHDASFYGRNRVIPALGFDEFIDQKAFAEIPRPGRYVPDLAAAELCGQLLERADTPLFVFIITMENHGPWGRPTEAFASRWAELPREVAETPGLAEYLERLRASDAMLAPLRDTFLRRGEGVLAVYGDHLPSLPLERLGLEGSATDYAVWRPGIATPASPRSVRAWELGRLVLETAGLAAL